jgi:hypothetical protein
MSRKNFLDVCSHCNQSFTTREAADSKDLKCNFCPGQFFHRKCLYKHLIFGQGHNCKCNTCKGRKKPFQTPTPKCEHCGTAVVLDNSSAMHRCYLKNSKDLVYHQGHSDEDAGFSNFVFCQVCVARLVAIPRVEVDGVHYYTDFPGRYLRHFEEEEYRLPATHAVWDICLLTIPATLSRAKIFAQLFNSPFARTSQSQVLERIQLVPREIRDMIKFVMRINVEAYRRCLRFPRVIENLTIEYVDDSSLLC